MTDLSPRASFLPASSSELRAATRAYYQAAAGSLVRLAAALARIKRDQLWREWGHHTFVAYVTREVGVSAKMAYDLTGTYERWAPVWDEIDNDPPPWSHLVEATPLLSAGLEEPGVLLARLRNGATVQRIRTWKDAKLPLRRYGTAVAEALPPLATRIAEGGVPIGDAGRDCGPSRYLVLHPDLEVDRRWIGQDGEPWATVKLALPEAVVELLSLALTGAEQQLGRAADAVASGLPGAVEAMAQECLASWPVPGPDTPGDPPPRSGSGGRCTSGGR